MHIVGFPKLFPFTVLVKKDPPPADPPVTTSDNCGKGKDHDKGKGKGSSRSINPYAPSPDADVSCRM